MSVDAAMRGMWLGLKPALPERGLPVRSNVRRPSARWFFHRRLSGQPPGGLKPALRSADFSPQQRQADCGAPSRATLASHSSRFILVLSALLWLAPARPVSSAEPADHPPAVAPDQLNQTIDDVIQQREYTWRFPRDKTEFGFRDIDYDLSLFERIGQSIEKAFKTVGRWVKDLIGWLKFNPQGRRASPGGGFDWGDAMRALVLILVLALAGLIVYLMLKLWKERAARKGTEAEAMAVSPAPDLEDENVGADELPENEWIVLARDLMAQGEYRLALRAYYLASLAHLSERHLITIARFKSNRDYERELQRRGHALPGLADVFGRNVTLFERVWYGMHDISPESVEQFAVALDQLKGGGAPA